MRPRAENAQNELPGATFEQMCGQELKMLKISFLGLLLARCAARGGKYRNELPGAIFRHAMFGQNLKMLQMSCPGLFLAICAARN